MNNQTNKPLYKNRRSAFDYYLVFIFALALFVPICFYCSLKRDALPYFFRINHKTTRLAAPTANIPIAVAGSGVQFPARQSSNPVTSIANAPSNIFS